MAKLLMDVRPLKHSPPFRRMWLGNGLSAIGNQMTNFAVALQVYTITHSAIAVGAVGLATGIPAVLFGLLGGTLIDAVDRRKLVLLTSSLLTLVSTAFAIQAYAELNQVWLLYLLVAIEATIGSVNGPARRTFIPRLLPPDQITAGAALTMLSMHSALIAGPALAGVIAAAWGLKVCYLIDVLTFAAALYGIARLPSMVPEGTKARPGFKAVGAALKFIRGNKVITGSFLADMNATILGAPFALFPAINEAHFGGSPQTLGLLTTAIAVGGVLGSGLSGPVGHITRQGRAMLIGGAVWGAGLIGFGLAQNFALALAMLVIAGTADVICVVLRTTMVQVTTPDEFRGRVSAAEMVVGAACPQLGNFRAGAIGSLASPAISVVTGGIATIAGSALLGLFLPAFARYRAK
ncbi:MFS transporter [Actinocrispum sp. NPDC049592]|uniref:MFS transporter n=1 Tax=Actinocrispum sp. NPDC049592 TaxID=3154835 RepID=UPI00342BACE4